MRASQQGFPFFLSLSFTFSVIDRVYTRVLLFSLFSARSFCKCVCVSVQKVVARPAGYNNKVASYSILLLSSAFTTAATLWEYPPHQFYNFSSFSLSYILSF